MIRVRGLPGQPHRGLLRVGNRAFPVALGRGGIGFDKREGDGRTPAGTWRILRMLYRGDRTPRPVSQLEARPIGADDGWCDDPQDRRYNQPVHLPLTASHEKMRREDGLYDIVLVLDHNTRPRVKGRGSAVFIHIARDGLKPTEGCVALPPKELKRLVARLRPGTRVVIEP
ncbi:L,D-transpeptidase family protein [Aquabacter sp. CN5-332]|uniref:L,D-transpeptidase family protein n=1 Tax=Aquabacter sp. CN5-332 TaxID=3156608 RepID=UPI0032B5B089